MENLWIRLADKLLVCSALICLVELKELPAWMVIVIISREFIISGFRLVASDNGVVIAASYWGKFKTTFQMIAVVLLIVGIPALSMVTTAVVWIALVLDCDLSGGLYHKKRECSERRENVMIRTEKGYGQIFKIYGVSETEVKDALKEILKRGKRRPGLYKAAGQGGPCAGRNGGD